MHNHLVGGKTCRNPVLGPVLLNHAQGDDPPLLGGLQPDLPLDHLVPGPANFPAAVERICVRPSS